MSSTTDQVRTSWRKNRRDWLPFLAFVAPNFIIFAIFTYWPILYSFYLSFTRWNFLTPQMQMVGLRNYTRLMQDDSFWEVLGNTLVYALSVVLIAQALAFFVALLLNRKMPGQPFFRTVVFTPHITTTAAAALIFVLLLDPQLGPLSYVYNFLHVQGPRFLGSTTLALWAIILVGIWKEIGFASVFFLAGLQGINQEYYEAARVDGAKPFAILRHITVPLMAPVIFFLLVSGFIQAVKVFDLVAVMTEGGPVYPSSATYAYHLYQLAFRNFRAGYASAFAIIFFIGVMAITLFQLRYSQRWVQYED